jgi:spore coat polysaccharide biosynthesis predicted glycosyltransferase SpsG
MGGSDPDGYTLAALHAMHLDKIDFEVTVVVGSSNQNIDAIKAYIKPFHNTVTLLVDVNNMAELMNAATLIVGAGGATNIERVFLHKPSLVFCVADNQVETTLDLEKTGCLKVLEVANIGLLGEEVRRLIRNQEALADMSNACVKVAAPPRLQELLSVILPPNPD